jgi:hypothetical protein
MYVYKFGRINASAIPSKAISFVQNKLKINVKHTKKIYRCHSPRNKTKA